MWILPLLLFSALVRGLIADEVERTDPETCPPQMDIAFLLDTSGSTEEIYREHVNWTLALIDALPVHKDAVRVTVIQFSGKIRKVSQTFIRYAESPIVEFHLGQYEEKGEILKHLEEMKFQSGVTKSGAALRAAEEQLFIESNGARRNVTKCVVIFTDGLSIDDPINPSYHLRNDKGVKIYVISIGITGFVPEMLQIAGEPENVFGPSDSERFKKQLLFDVENSRVCPQDLLIAREVSSAQINQTVDTESINPITKFPVLISDPTFTIEYPDDDESVPLSINSASIPENTTTKKVEPTTTKTTKKTPIFHRRPKISTVASIIKNETTSSKTSIEVLSKPALPTEANTINEKLLIVEPVKLNKVPAKVAQHAIQLKTEKLASMEAVKEKHIIANQTAAIIETSTISPDQPKPQLPEKVRKVKKVRRIIRRLRKRKGANALTAKPLEGRRKIVRKVVHKSRALGASSQNNKIHNESIIPELPAGLRTVETVPLQTIRAHGRFIKRTITPKKRQSITADSVEKTEKAIETITLPTLLTTLEATTKSKARPWINPSKLRSLTSTASTKTETLPRELKPVQKTTKVSAAKKILPVESTTELVTVPAEPKTTSAKPVANQFAVKTTEVEKTTKCPLDILFIVDSSGSIQNIYDKQKTYLSSLLQSIDPELKSHRVSLIQFSSAKTQKMEWTFDSYSQNEQLMKAFNGVRYFTGTTYIGAALKLALTELESRRENVPTIVVLVSDGFSQDDAIEYSNKINSLENVEFFVVSLATLNNNKYLGKMVESDGNVYIGKDAEFFRAKLLERLQCS